MNLDKTIKKLIEEGECDPNRLFKRVYPLYPGHYSKVREAIHNAKTK